MWWSEFAIHNPADHDTACFHPQQVCDSPSVLPAVMLTMPLPVFILSLYVIVSICYQQLCWLWHYLFPLSGSMWWSHSAAHSHADYVTVHFHPWRVCDGLKLLPIAMLTMTLPVSTLRKYVMVSICCPQSCWPCHCLCLSLDCMWFSAYSHADDDTVCFHSQKVCDSLNLLPSYAGDDTACFHPQLVIDGLNLLSKHTNHFLLCCHLRKYVAFQICCPPIHWLYPCHQIVFNAFNYIHDLMMTWFQKKSFSGCLSLPPNSSNHPPWSFLELCFQWACIINSCFYHLWLSGQCILSGSMSSFMLSNLSTAMFSHPWMHTESMWPSSMDYWSHFLIAYCHLLYSRKYVNLLYIITAILITLCSCIS